MKSGSIGDVAFETSDRDVFTFRGMSAKREMVFGEHSVLEGIPRLQHTGRKLDTMSLPVVIDASRPKAVPFLQRYNALVVMAGEGEHVPLVLGTSYMGEWVVNSVSLDSTVQHGDCVLCGTITMALTEYN